jgi:hypothetical protein
MKPKNCIIKTGTKNFKDDPAGLAKRMAEVQQLKRDVRVAEVALRPKTTSCLRSSRAQLS